MPLPLRRGAPEALRRRKMVIRGGFRINCGWWRRWTAGAPYPTPKIDPRKKDGRPPGRVRCPLAPRQTLQHGCDMKRESMSKQARLRCISARKADGHVAARRGKKSPAYGHAKQPTGPLAADKAKKEKWSPPGGCLARSVAATEYAARS